MNAQIIGQFFLLSNVGKVIEKLMHKIFLNEHNILYQKPVCFSKKYPTVHVIMLEKCSHYGTRDTARNWFSSYLPNKNKFVTVNGFYLDLWNV